MKHFWTAAAVTALLGLGATEADAATKHKKHTDEAAAASGTEAAAASSKTSSKSRHGRTALRGAEKADDDSGASHHARSGRSHAKAPEADDPEAKPTAGRRSRHGHVRTDKAAAAQEETPADARESRSGHKGSGRRTRHEAAADEADDHSASRHGVIRTEAPAPVTVGKGDTLFALSRKTGVDRETIAQLNGLKPPYHLRPGQEIKLPSRRYIAVQKGETISSAAKKVGADPVAIAAYNEADLNGRVRAGAKLYVPDDVHEPEAPKPAKQASNRRTGADRRSRERTTEVAAAEEAPARVATTRRTPSARRPATSVTSPPPTRYAQARPAQTQAPISRAAPDTTTAPASDGLDAATGLPNDTGANASGNTATAPTALAASGGTPVTQTPPATRPPVQVATNSATAPRPVRPSATPYTRTPTYSRPSVVAPNRAPSQSQNYPAQGFQPPTSSGFQMVPSSQQMARDTSTPSSGGVPYNSLGNQGSGGHDRQGRPTTLPPQIAMIAPSSQPAIIAEAPPPKLTDIVAAGRGRFMWPVHGAVLQGFKHTPNGPGNDGVNIAAQPGEAVRAAAAGEVVYAGDQVPSFGNLVLVKHANGWVTAYAHMAGITVKNRDQVAQGQQIGIAGNTGNVGVTQLHFEMRYSPSSRDKAQPIDPMLILPGL